MVCFGFEGRVSYVLEILNCQAELGQDFLVSDDLSARNGGAGLGDLASLFRSGRFVVIRGVSDSAGDGIKHDLEQANGDGNLTGSHAINQFVRVLFRICGCKSHFRQVHECAQCGYHCSVTAGTIFHKTRTPLVSWFWAIYRMSHDKKGI
jgi:hypothetical protein